MPSLVALWHAAAAAPSVSTRREAALCLLRMAAVPRLRAALEKQENAWLVCVAQELGMAADRAEGSAHAKALRKLLTRSQQLCLSVQEAALFEQHALTSITALELTVLATGEFFLEAVAEHEHGLEKIMRLLETSPDPGFRLWSEGCAKSLLKRDGSAAAARRALCVVGARRSSGNGSETRAALSALCENTGMWYAVCSKPAVAAELLGELDRVISLYLQLTKNNVEQISMVWMSLMAAVAPLLPTFLQSAPSAAQVIGGWIFRGVTVATSKAFSATEQWMLADPVRAFVNSFLEAIGKAPQDVRRRALVVWIECPGSTPKSVASTGLEAMRKVVSVDSVNAEVSIQVLYKMLVEMCVMPTLRLLLNDYAAAADDRRLSAAMSLVLLLLRCRSSSSGRHQQSSPHPAFNVLVDVSAALKMVENAGWQDFAAQLGELCQEHDALRPDPIWRISVWTLMGTAALARLDRKGEGAAPQKLLSRLPIAVFASPGASFPDAEVWRDVLAEAIDVWKRVAELTRDKIQRDDVASNVAAALEDTYNKLLQEPDVNAAWWCYAVEVAVRMLCCMSEDSSNSVATVLSISGGKEPSNVGGAVVGGVGSVGDDLMKQGSSSVSKLILPVGGYMFLLRPMTLASLLLQLILQASVAPEVTKKLHSLVDDLMGGLGHLLRLPPIHGTLSVMLQTLRPLLESWVVSSPRLLTSILQHLRLAIGADPSLTLAPSELRWLLQCLDSSKPTVHSPALQLWNELLVARTVGEWDEEWRATLQRLKDSKGTNSVQLPSDLTLLSSSSAPAAGGEHAGTENGDGEDVGGENSGAESEPKRQRLVTGTPSLHLSDEMMPPTQPVFSPSKANAALAQSALMAPTQVAPEEDDDGGEDQQQQQQQQQRQQGFSFVPPPPQQNPSAVRAASNMVLDLSTEQQVRVLRQLVDSLPPEMLARVLSDLLHRLPVSVVAEKIAARLQEKK